MTLFKTLEKQKKSHEQIIFCFCPISGLKAIIAIHSTKLGPALGGCRIHPYRNEDQALRDALKLSETMSYKAAIAGLKHGGGKSVIIANPETQNKPELLRAFGSHLESLNGRYYTGKDLGITVKDLNIIKERSSYILGCGSNKEDNPSYFTAKGVYYGIKQAVKWQLKKESLKGIRVLIQGVGAVGFKLMEFLIQDQAKVFISDIRESILIKIKSKFKNVKIISKEEVYTTPCEVFSPCSIGGVINEESVQKLNCSIIAGGANNQLSSLSIEKTLSKKNILYIPDFVINGGGIIYVSSLVAPKKSNTWVENKIKNIPVTIKTILKTSKALGISPSETALQLAKNKVKQAVKKHRFTLKKPAS